MSEAQFDFVNIIAFNRPEIFAQVAASLAAQDFGEAALHVWIDGFHGSADEERGKADRTNEVLAIARRFLPQAVVHDHTNNLGVARIYDAAETLALAHSTAPFVLFFEDDLVLGPNYLEALQMLMRWAAGHEDVAIVTAHGYAHEWLGEAKKQLPPPAGLTYVHSLWAYAVKRQHMNERKSFIDDYLKIVARDRYHRRSGREIKQHFIDHGVGFVVGTSQDFAKHAALWLFNRCALTIPLRLANYIGMDGLHANPAMYRELGYGAGEIAPFDAGEYAALLARGFNRTETLAVRLLELHNVSIGNLALTVRRKNAEIEALKRR